MSIHTIISLISMLLWLIMAANILYILFFALASIMPGKGGRTKDEGGRTKDEGGRTKDEGGRTKEEGEERPSFLVLFPAYHEDAVIINSVETFLKQDYPKDRYKVIVISDNMRAETNAKLASMPITLLQPQFEKSSKATALQYAVHSSQFTVHSSLTSKAAEPSAQFAISHLSPLPPHPYVVILDADNVVESDFLTRLSEIACMDEAIQCHRTAKNANNDIAALDGLSEEINNSIFRRGHNRIGMSSALIGSGMCFDYEWFKNHVGLLDSAVEDRELEALLMKQGIFIRYAEDILVMDEKVSNSDNFQRQRLRWMTGQVQALMRMLPYMPKAIITGNINYIDKTIQQALIPRSLLLVLTPLFALLFTVHSLQFTVHSSAPLLWWLLVVLLILALFIAIPARLRTTALIGKALTLPALVWRMLTNILHIKPQNKEFIHTTHNQ